jgi:transcriptional regulator with XRE-family HTH domain
VDIELVLEAREAAKSGRGARLRRAAGLSQGELAGACEVSTASVSRWEAGERIPRGAAAERYALVLRMLARRLVGDPVVGAVAADP